MKGSSTIWFVIQVGCSQHTEQIAKNCQLPLEFTDERLSSAEAKKILRAQGLSEKAMRGKVDMLYLLVLCHMSDLSTS